MDSTVHRRVSGTPILNALIPSAPLPSAPGAVSCRRGLRPHEKYCAPPRPRSVPVRIRARGACPALHSALTAPAEVL